MNQHDIRLCPKCRGQKIVGKPPWVDGDVEVWTSGQAGGYVCPVCQGRGVIAITDKICGGGDENI